jgi:hypothetical protein
MEKLNENMGGNIENEFQDWLDMMYTSKDYPEIETLETVIDYAQATLRDYRLDENKKIKNLNEGKKKKGGMAYEAALREIDAQSAIVAMEAKINKLEEMAAAKEQRLSMVSEDENLSELISKSAVKEMQKEIKEIRKMQEKLKKVYEKKNGKKPEAKEIVDEEEKVDETYGSTTYEEDDSVKEGGYDSNYEEDDVKEEKEETNEEVNRWQKLAGL